MNEQDDKTPLPDTNGKGSIAHQVAAHLKDLVDRSGRTRRQLASNEVRLDGLARVILRPEVPFGTETAGGIADVIKEQGDIYHEAGSDSYEVAELVRAAK